jgi:hypothetical protein
MSAASTSKPIQEPAERLGPTRARSRRLDFVGAAVLWAQVSEIRLDPQNRAEVSLDGLARAYRRP